MSAATSKLLAIAFFAGAACLALPLILLYGDVSSAQTKRTIRIIVPSTVGGGADLLARLLADHMGRAQNIKVVVENRPGASNTIGTYVLPRMISKFCNSNPGIKVSVFVGNTAQVSQGIAEQRYSLGFIEGPLHVRGLTAIRFGDDILLPVVAAGHRLANVPDVVPSDLDDEPLLMRELGSGTRELITDILHGLKIVEGPVMEFGNTEAIKQAVIHDAGIAWLPALSIRTELENGALVPLASDQLTIRRSLNVIRRDSSPGSPANDAFIRLLIQ